MATQTGFWSMAAGDVLLVAGLALGGLALLGMAAAGVWLAWEQRKGGAA